MVVPILSPKPPVSRRQYAANGTFEIDIASWIAGASTTREHTITDAFEGTGSMLVTATAAAGTHQVQTDPNIPLTGGTLGQRYRIQIRVKGLGTTVGKTYRLQIREVGGSQAIGAMIASPNYVMPADWTVVQKEGTILQNDRTHIDIDHFILGTPASGEQYLIDHVQLIRIS